MNVSDHRQLSAGRLVSLAGRRGRRGAAPGALLERLEDRQLLAADILIDALVVNNAPLPGVPAQVSLTLRNPGTTLIDTDFSVEYYLSTDSGFDPGDALLDTQQVTMPLQADGTLAFPRSLTIPDGTAVGDYFIVVRADAGETVAETNEGNNTGSAAFVFGNVAPTIDAFTATPGTATRTQQLTLTATGVADGDTRGDVLEVRFYHDTNSDGVFGGEDTLLGLGTRSGSTFTLTTGVPAAFEPGTVRLFARATDGIDTASRTTTLELTPSTMPTVSTLTKTEAGVARWAGPLTLRATGVHAADTGGGAITGVQFYRDVNTNGEVDEGTDELLGAGVDAGDGVWQLPTLTVPSGAWGTSATFLVRATDSLMQTSQPAVATFALADVAAPIIGGLTVSPTPVARSSTLTLTATNVTGDFNGPGAGVAFYRDSNRNGAFDDADDLLATAAGSAFTATVQAGDWTGDSVRFFAIATDRFGQTSETQTVQVGLVDNQPPSVGSLRFSKGNVRQGETVRLTARDVTDNGGVSTVRFYLDRNRDGELDASDPLLGEGTPDGTDDWVLDLDVPRSFRVGNNRVFAQAVDSAGALSDPVSRTIRVTGLNAKPTFGELVTNKGQVNQGQTLVVRLRDVTDDNSVGEVRFYHDTNENGRIDSNADTLLGLGTREGNSDHWRLRFTVPASFERGENTLLARVVDNIGANSATAETTINVRGNQKPTIGGFTVTGADPLTVGTPVVFRASNVRDDASVAGVAFYRDTNGDGRLRVADDEFLGNGTRSGRNWTLDLDLPASFVAGDHRVFTLVTDNLGRTASKTRVITAV